MNENDITEKAEIVKRQACEFMNAIQRKGLMWNVAPKLGIKINTAQRYADGGRKPKLETALRILMFKRTHYPNAGGPCMDLDFFFNL